MTISTISSMSTISIISIISTIQDQSKHHYQNTNHNHHFNHDLDQNHTCIVLDLVVNKTVKLNCSNFQLAETSYSYSLTGCQRCKCLDFKGSSILYVISPHFCAQQNILGTIFWISKKFNNMRTRFCVQHAVEEECSCYHPLLPR